jgi:hypothetical protein
LMIMSEGFLEILIVTVLNITIGQPGQDDITVN